MPFDEDPFEWLDKLFECRYCAECGGDAQHHDVCAGPLGWFARCRFPAPVDSDKEWHPIIKAFRIREGL